MTQICMQLCEQRHKEEKEEIMAIMDINLFVVVTLCREAQAAKFPQSDPHSTEMLHVTGMFVPR